MYCCPSRFLQNPLRQKAAQIAGINPNNFRAVPTTRADAFGLTADALRATIEADIEAGLVPLFLCPTIGTTSSTAVDPLGPLCDVAEEYGIWVHVDAAYAGSICICPEYRHFLDGIEKAHSFSFNAHKWFLTTLDCCCLWVKDPGALIKALSTYPEYLRNKASETKQVVDYKDWQITLSRRFRSLKLWLVIRSYGVANLRKFLRSHVKMAKNFEGLIGMDKRFEVVVPRNFATVCFRISPIEIGGNHQIVTKEDAANNFNAKLLESINESGKIYMTHAVIGGVYVMRFAVGASLTENKHVIWAWKVVQEHANALLTSS
ncbi:UNVERIFIED_CONTAM: Tyrosine/DOPA decarboxylase 5 [Sesamum radiatum]|uniref:Tyrosine/DOPA decarboxylase 5 n=1 Tax=Sesamum radiatum TaxID=300843 RepID=A0AAW2T0U5_SESRA